MDFSAFVQQSLIYRMYVRTENQFLCHLCRFSHDSAHTHVYILLLMTVLVKLRVDMRHLVYFVRALALFRKPIWKKIT